MELDNIKKLIKEKMLNHSKVIVDSLSAERYYKNENDILSAQKKNNEDAADNPLRSADNRISNNFHNLLVNQKASYLFTEPPTFDTEGKGKNDKRIKEILGDNFSAVCKDLCINASNSGVAWLHYWKGDETSLLNYAVVDSKQIIPIWSTRLDKNLLGVLRVYQNTDALGDTYDIYEYWNDQECQAFRKKVGQTLDEGLEAYLMFSLFIEDTQTMEVSNAFKHAFDRVPFIEFANNNIKKGDLNNVKALIDVYDKIFSGFVNDLEDIQEIIFILTNYDGESLSEFLGNLKKYKTVQLESNDSEKSGLQTLTIDIPIEARKELLLMSRKAIFEQGQGMDPLPESFGDVSGVSLKYKYCLLELKSGLVETEFRKGFGELIRAICHYLNITVKLIIQTWTRTAIANDAELASIGASSDAILSKKTILKHHPFVENADVEMEEIKKEDKEAMDVYGEGLNLE